MLYPESSAFKSFKKRFKEKLKKSELYSDLPVKFFNDPDDKNREKVENVTEIQVHLTVFYTLKAKSKSTDIETFVRKTIPTQSLSKNQFEQRVFTRENFRVSNLLAQFSISLSVSCKSCDSLDFCYNCWLCLNHFFSYDIPPHAVIPEQENKTDRAEYARKALIKKTFADNTCECVYPAADRQGFFNYCDFCCDNFESKLREPAELYQCQAENNRQKICKI